MNKQNVTMADTQQALFLRGITAYEHSSLFMSEMAQGFEKMGYSSVVMDMRAADFLSQLRERLLLGPVKFVCSYNAQALGLKMENDLLINRLEVPFVGWYADHPAYHFSRMATPVDQNIMLFIEQNHVALAQKLFPQPGIKGFFPLAGNRLANPPDIVYSQREYPLIFIGSYMPEDSVKAELTTRNPILNDIIWSTLDIAKTNNDTDIAELFDRQLQAAGMNPLDLDKDIVLGIVTLMDRYIRGFRRNHVISAIRKTPLRVYGSGWENGPPLGDNVTLCGPIDLPDALKVIANSRILLNVLPNFKSGPHDRIFTAMLQGAISVTDSNPWLDAELRDGENAIFYRTGGGDLEDKIQHVLANPDLMADIAQAGQQFAEANHTWEHRARLLDRFIDAHHLQRHMMAAK